VPGYRLPEDLRAFYGLCGGVDINVDQPYELHIVPASRLLKANPVIAGCEGEGDISYDWFILAENSGQYVTIDLGKERTGRCYDSFWDCHAVAGSSMIIALSYTDFLSRVAEHTGEGWYWIASGFSGFGDAYEGM